MDNKFGISNHQGNSWKTYTSSLVHILCTVCCHPYFYTLYNSSYITTSWKASYESVFSTPQRKPPFYTPVQEIRLCNALFVYRAFDKLYSYNLCFSTVYKTGSIDGNYSFTSGKCRYHVALLQLFAEPCSLLLANPTSSRSHVEPCR